MGLPTYPSGRSDILLPSSAEEGRALAWPAPGVVRSLIEESSKRFVARIRILKLGTKRPDDSSWHFPQTTPRSRCATAVAARLCLS